MDQMDLSTKDFMDVQQQTAVPGLPAAEESRTGQGSTDPQIMQQKLSF
jgi:hypothetical protein